MPTPRDSRRAISTSPPRSGRQPRCRRPQPHPGRPGKASFRPRVRRKVRPQATRLQYTRPEQASLDGNTVDLNRERAAFADNSLHYEATLRFINGRVRTMMTAIRGE